MYENSSQPPLLECKPRTWMFFPFYTRVRCSCEFHYPSNIVFISL